ncbi:MAG: hypothetical protein JW892_15620 [Anaerolineae bacterium]|nr:hypothetical protein [Anaerolineae bacterium]
MNPRLGYRTVICRRHKWRKCWTAALLIVLLLAVLGGCLPTPVMPPGTQVAPSAVLSDPAAPETGLETLRLFMIYGGDVSSVWALQVRTGILETLVGSGGYRIGETLFLEEYQLPADIGTLVAPDRTAISEAIALSQAFSPTVVITVGNQATRQIVQTYPDPNQRIVFCSFSGNVLASGLSRANVAGVLELPYPIQTARLAVNMVPNSTKFMVLGDVSSTDAMSTEVIFDTLLKDPPYPALPIWRQTDDWDEWQAFVAESDTVDFVILGKADHVRDASGNLIPPEEVLRWTLLNSTAPVFGMWQDIVTAGAVAGLVLSGGEQGKAVANLLLKIARGTDPAVLLPARPERNILALNLAAARHWGVLPSFDLLVTASSGGTFPE